MQATSDILAKVKLIVEGNAEYGDGILLSLTAFLQGENFGSKKQTSHHAITVAMTCHLQEF